MFDKMHPVVKAVIMFILGCVLMLAVTWLTAMIKNEEFVVNWLYIIGMGAVIVILDFVFPASTRRQNRKNLKDKLTRK